MSESKNQRKCHASYQDEQNKEGSKIMRTISRRCLSFEGTLEVKAVWAQGSTCFNPSSSQLGGLAGSSAGVTSKSKSLAFEHGGHVQAHGGLKSGAGLWCPFLNGSSENISFRRRFQLRPLVSERVSKKVPPAAFSKLAG